ncbi:MAG: ferrous iron transport protein A [Firmicutes bacterium]|nr:ferrous iron transport protein A [Bacillota bacterium]
MMPINLAPVGEESIILKVSGSPETKQHLQDIGFVPGGKATVISSNGGNIIVNVKNVRVAVTREMAQKIFV